LSVQGSQAWAKHPKDRDAHKGRKPQFLGERTLMPERQALGYRRRVVAEGLDVAPLPIELTSL
jgi:hypothetical protein